MRRICNCENSTTLGSDETGTTRNTHNLDGAADPDARNLECAGRQLKHVSGLNRIVNKTLQILDLAGLYRRDHG